MANGGKIVIALIGCLVSVVWGGEVVGGYNKNCPVSCTCDDETLTVVCNQLFETPITLNPITERLIVRDNKIRTVDVASFQFYRALKYIDFANNHLVRIPANAFILQDKLTELYLNKNRISNLAEKTFIGLKSLTVLNFRENFLEELPNRIFTGLHHLLELDLGHNRIRKIEPGAFDGLVQLKVLYLEDNQLKQVPTPTFPNIRGLAELKIGSNEYKDIHGDAFAGLEQLTTLDLSGTGGIPFHENSFKGLSTLRSLTLKDNEFENVPTLQLSRLPRLEKLILGQNNFHAIDKDAFKSLNNLKHIEISGAVYLVRIENEAFRSNLNLETLALISNKQLSVIEDGALQGLPNLKNLILRDNGFTNFAESLVAWPELRQIDLTDNPLVCRCNMLWMRDLLLQRNFSHVLCIEPKEFKGTPLRSLSDSDLGCEIYGKNHQTVIGAICGVSLAIVAFLLVLMCRYRHSLRDLFKNYKFKKQAMVVNVKQNEYQKTFSDDEFIIRTAHHHSLKPIPVTEL